MKPDDPGIEDDDDGGGIYVIAHFRKRPARDAHAAHGAMAGQRYDRASRSMNNPSLHPFLYNGLHSPTMDVATGQEPRPWAPEQAGLSVGAELQPPKPDRGPRSGHEPADITGDHQYLTERTAPPAHNPLSAAAGVHRAPYREKGGHEDDTPASRAQAAASRRWRKKSYPTLGQGIAAAGGDCRGRV
jgi:hypothetical protein